MVFSWRQRAYCAPTLSSLKTGEVCEVGSLSFHEGLLAGEGGLLRPQLRCNSETLSPLSHLPLGLLGELTNTTMPGTDVFFLPKPSNLLKFALPTLVFLPNLTIFTKSWPFYASKAY